MSAALTLSIDDALRTRLESVATQRNMTPEAVVEIAVTSFLDESERALPDLAVWQLDMIEEGRAAAERGEFASEEDVDRVLSKYRS